MNDEASMMMPPTTHRDDERRDNGIAVDYINDAIGVQIQEAPQQYYHRQHEQQQHKQQQLDLRSILSDIEASVQSSSELH